MTQGAHPFTLAPLALLALIGGYGCTRTHGGQAGDDGAPRTEDRSPGGDAKPDGAVPPPDDAGVIARYTVPTVVVLDGPISEYACAAGLHGSLDSGNAAQLADGADNACHGTEGTWRCSCNGETSVSHAIECPGALFERCHVQAEALVPGRAGTPLATCVATLASREGSCDVEPEQGFGCKCPGGGSEVMGADSCEAALWSACAAPCSDDYGTCRPSTDDEPGSYDCTCTYAGNRRRVMYAASCDDALTLGCGLEPALDYEGCNGYGGYCERKDEMTLRCSCADGSEHEVPQEYTERASPCRHALETVCGDGDPPPEQLCTLENNGFSARCVRAPAASAPHECECVLHGANADEWVETAQHAGMSCQEALLATCPLVRALDAADRERACDYYANCDTRYLAFSPNECAATAPDVCVACTIDDLDRLASFGDVCASRGVSCGDACTELVPRAAAVEACEKLLDVKGLLDDASRCMCDRCHPTFGQCAADAGCLELVGCATTTGCTQATCSSDPLCGPIVSRIGQHSIALALQLDTCDARIECAALKP